jgi:hypothetical protein
MLESEIVALLLLLLVCSSNIHVISVKEEDIQLYFLSLKEDEMGRACSTNGGEEECI